MITGSCLCQAVRFEIDAPLEPIQACHCGQCRKAQGGAFATNVPVSTEHLRFVSGEDHLQAYESTPGKERVFCRTCGSPVFSRLASKPGVVRIRAGSLDNPTGGRLGFHFYVASKADWWDIADDLPQYPDARPA